MGELEVARFLSSPPFSTTSTSIASMGSDPPAPSPPSPIPLPFLHLCAPVLFSLILRGRLVPVGRKMQIQATLTWGQLSFSQCFSPLTVKWEC